MRVHFLTYVSYTWGHKISEFIIILNMARKWKKICHANIAKCFTIQETLYITCKITNVQNNQKYFSPGNLFMRRHFLTYVSYTWDYKIPEFIIILNMARKWIQYAMQLLQNVCFIRRRFIQNQCIIQTERTFLLGRNRNFNFLPRFMQFNAKMVD